MYKWMILCQNEHGRWAGFNDRIGVDGCKAMLDGVSLVSSFYTKDTPQAIVDLTKVRSVLFDGSVCPLDATEVKE